MRRLLALVAILLFSTASARAEAVIQQIDTGRSKMHFEMSGSLLALSGKFNRYNGSISLAPGSLSPQKVILKIDVSDVEVAPVENLPYLSPEAIFRAIPNSVVTFTSTNISEVSPNNFRIQGKTTRGGKVWETTFKAVRRKSSASESEFYLNMSGPISSFVSELPPTFQGMQQEGTLECTLNFKRE